MSLLATSSFSASSSVPPSILSSPLVPPSKEPLDGEELQLSLLPTDRNDTERIASFIRSSSLPSLNDRNRPEYVSPYPRKIIEIREEDIEQQQEERRSDREL